MAVVEWSAGVVDLIQVFDIRSRAAAARVESRVRAGAFRVTFCPN